MPRVLEHHPKLTKRHAIKVETQWALQPSTPNNANKESAKEKLRNMFGQEFPESSCTETGKQWMGRNSRRICHG
eukprot:c41278_g1_i1 orf=60-281(-)